MNRKSFNGDLNHSKDVLQSHQIIGKTRQQTCLVKHCTRCVGQSLTYHTRRSLLDCLDGAESGWTLHLLTPRNSCDTWLRDFSFGKRALLAGLFFIFPYDQNDRIAARTGENTIQKTEPESSEATPTEQSTEQKEVVGRYVGALGHIEPVSGVVTVHGRKPGVVKKCLIEQNQSVKSGDLLAVFTSHDEQQNAVERAKVSLTMAEHALFMMRKKWNRWNTIRPGAISEQSKDEIECEYKTSQEKVRMAQLDLEHQQILLEDTVVRAPMDGVILDVVAKEGAMTNDQGVVVMGDVHHMRVIAEVHEDDIVNVHQGQSVQFSIDGLKETFQGTVRVISRLIRATKLWSSDPRKHQDALIVEVIIDVPRHSVIEQLVHRKVYVRIGGPGEKA